MEFRTKKRTLAVLSGLILLAPAVCAQQELRYEAWHVHSRSARVSQARRVGTLIISETSLSFQETYRSGKTPKHPHAWNWGYQEIQQLKMLPKSVTVLTYKDNKWKFGADREY